MKKYMLALSLVVISACTTKIYPASSPYYVIAASSTVTVNRTLTIEPNLARVYFQYGKVISEKQKQKYQPNCSILVKEVRETTQTIKPGTFSVLRSYKSEEYVKHEGQRLYASLLLGIGEDEAGGPTAVEYTTSLDLASKEQPGVMRLECTYWENPEDAQHLTLAQMQQALGEWVTIRTAD